MPQRRANEAACTGTLPDLPQPCRLLGSKLENDQLMCVYASSVVQSRVLWKAYIHLLYFGVYASIDTH
jgi:hypothetical protein